MSASKNFSLVSLFTAGLACLAPFASAYTKPVGAEPKGNPISQPGLASIVPAGNNFTVTWDPTTKGTVTLVLLKGPASNLQVVYPIAEKIDNSGSYAWDVKKDLAPTADDTGYGIQLIVDATGQYQYTTQFGISNPDFKAVTPSSYASATSSSASISTSTSASSKASMAAASATGYVKAGNNTSSASAYLTGTGAAYPTGSAAPTGYLPHNGSMIHPTGAMTGSSSYNKTTSTLATSASASATGASATSSIHPSTGGASTMATSFAGLVIAAGVAVFAL